MSLMTQEKRDWSNFVSAWLQLQNAERTKERSMAPISGNPQEKIAERDNIYLHICMVNNIDLNSESVPAILHSGFNLNEAVRVVLL